MAVKKKLLLKCKSLQAFKGQDSSNLG